MSKKDFGKLGSIKFESEVESEQKSIVQNADLIKNKNFIKVSTGAVLGTAVVLGALHPFEVRAGATGMP